MKFSFNYLPRPTTSKLRSGIVTGEIPGKRTTAMLIMVMLAFALAACNLPQKKTLSGAQAGNNASKVTDTPTTNADAGSATLNLRRDYSFDKSTQSDVQTEAGAIPLVFSKSTEGNLIVEGKGKTDWTEVTKIPGCSFTAKAEGKITVTGIFSLDDCLFHLTIATKFSQPTTTYQDQDPEVCSGSIQFNQPKSSSRVELDPNTNRFKETKETSWWEMTTVSLSDMKSDVVQNCFKPEVIEHSK